MIPILVGTSHTMFSPSSASKSLRAVGWSGYRVTLEKKGVFFAHADAEKKENDFFFSLSLSSFLHSFLEFFGGGRKEKRVFFRHRVNFSP